jgi:signal transduction histidine kinase
MGRVDAGRRTLPLLWALAAACAAVAVVLGALASDDSPAFDVTAFPLTVLFAICGLAYVAVGSLVVRRAGGHPVGWLIVTAGSLYLVGLAAGICGEWWAGAGHVDTWSAIGSWAHDWTWELAAAAAVAALALFPNRRPDTRLGRALLVVIVTYSAVQLVAITLAPGPLVDGAHRDNPFGVAALGSVPQRAFEVAEAVSWAATVVAMLSLIGRYRTATGRVRQQLRWLCGTVVAFLAGAVVVGVAGLFGVGLVFPLFLFVLIALPGAMAAAILRDHLYGIDVIVDRVVVYTLLAALIGAVCGIVTLLAHAVFAGGEPPTSAVSVVAIVAATLVVLPARERLGRLADRLAFGARATPLHALGTFAETSAAAGSIHDLAPRLAGLVAETTGAAVVVVYVRVDDEFAAVAREPDRPPGGNVSLTALDDELARYHHASLVERRGEVLGAIALTMPPGTPLRPTERRVVQQLAAQAALGFETLRLNAELVRHAAVLEAQTAELTRSRQRLVTVQDAERQRIGRDLHDGAQQQLIAIIAKAMLARTQLHRDPSRADATLQELQQDTRGALGEIRDFVNGIFPQVLADHGLVVALQQRAVRFPFAVAVDVEPTVTAERLDPSVEATAWFVVGEALTNVAKHAAADRVCIRLRWDAGLAIEIVDDGVGINGHRRGNGLTNMGDRVAAIGGNFDVAAGPTGGTVVRCHLPAVMRGART